MAFSVRQARTYAGLTQNEMAKRLGISRDAYRKIEQNPETTPVRLAIKISEVTGIPIDQIFFVQNST